MIHIERGWGGNLSDADLLSYYDWASHLIDDSRWWRDEEHPVDYIVRSSAVFSEDGEKATGAGVYDSVRVYGGSEFKDFKDAVVKVYESTESPQARAYRAQYGIDKEEMGLIIQKYAVSDRHSLYGQSNEGYVNSRLPGTPQLYEVVTGTSRNFIRRDELDFFIALDADHHDDAFRKAHHFRPDIYKVDEHLPVRITQIANAIEKLWGGDIQMEFVYDGPIINVVQVRELPQSAQPEVEIQFPSQPAVHTGAAVGFGDIDLQVLDNGADNSEKTGVVVFPSNEMFSMGNNSYHLPKEGAVIITRLGGYNGHIQTLCAERGLICIFPDINSYDEESLNYGQLTRLGRVRVVSNGIEGRLYRSHVTKSK